MHTDPDGKRYAHNAEQAEAHKLALAEGDGPVSNETARAYLRAYPAAPFHLSVVIEYPHESDAPALGRQECLGGTIVALQFSDALSEIETLRDGIDCAVNALTDSVLCSGNDAATNMHFVRKLKALLSGPNT